MKSDRKKPQNQGLMGHQRIEKSYRLLPLGSPLVASGIASLIEDFREEGEQIRRVALEAVKE